MAGLSIPWKILYSKTAVFTQVQATMLAEKHKLTHEQIGRLNEILNQVLSRFQIVADYDEVINSQRKAKEAFEAALKSIDAACRKTETAISTLRGLNMHSETPDIAMKTRHESLIETLEIAKAMCGRARVLFSKDRDVGLLLSLEVSSDARRHQDVRRRLVCDALIQFWREAGKKGHFSTNEDPRTKHTATPNAAGNLPSVRGGPLVRFIQDVVELTTEPATRLNEETIKKEITISRDAGKRRAAEADNGAELP